jgi:Holliday junction resolvase YEN1
MRAWREILIRELHTNESKHFKTKHPRLLIPATFPDVTILRYYTNPAVSSLQTVQRLKTELDWDRDIDIVGLRRFVADAFDWRFKTGAKRFIRGLAPSLMVLKLRTNQIETDLPQSSTDGSDDAVGLVRAICGKRENFHTDGLEELRVKCIPLDVVGLDLEAEKSDDGYVGDVGGDADEEELPTLDVTLSPSKRQPSVYDPSVPENIWILGTYVRCGAPRQVEVWEEAMRQPKKTAAADPPLKRTKNKARRAEQKGTMDRFVKITKPSLLPPPTFALGGTSPIREQFRTNQVPPSPAKRREDDDTRSTTDKVSTGRIKRGAILAKAQHLQPRALASKGTQSRSLESLTSSGQSPPTDPIMANPWTLSRTPHEGAPTPRAVNRKLDFLPPGLQLRSHVADLGGDDELPELLFSPKEAPMLPAALQQACSPSATGQVVEVLSSPSEARQGASEAFVGEASLSEARRAFKKPDTPKATKPRRLVALRESSEGTWKEVDEPEAQTRAKVFRDVEVVDLSHRLT